MINVAPATGNLAGIPGWFVPSEPESALFEQLMSHYPKPSTPHSFPQFHPHITLAAIGATPYQPPPPPPAVEGAAAAAAAAAATSAHEQGTDPHPHPNMDPGSTMLLVPREAVTLAQRAIRVLASDHYFCSIYIALAQQAQREQKGPTGPRPNLAASVPPPLALLCSGRRGAHAQAVLQELGREEVLRHSADGLSVALLCAGDGGGGRSTRSSR